MASSNEPSQSSRPPYSQSFRTLSNQDAAAEIAPSARQVHRDLGLFSSNPLSPITTREQQQVTDEPDLVQKPAIHRLNATGSVQAVIVDDQVLFAGLQGGDIVAWSLETYEQLARIRAHSHSVLSLSLSEDKRLLFSCGVDSIVNVWSTDSLERLYSLHSHYDVGDVFCVVYSAKSKTLFCGAQNASIQWQRLAEEGIPRFTQTSDLPAARKHRFFDSFGPGGVPSPVPQSNGTNGQPSGGQVLTIPNTNYVAYAHKSYIYSMVLAKGLDEDQPEQEVLVTAGGGGAIKIWSLEDLRESGLKLLHKFKNRGQSVLSLAYKAPFLYAGLTNGVAHVYNLASQQLVQKLQVGYGDITQIQILGADALCGTSEGWVKRSSNRFTEIERWRAHDGKILATAISNTTDSDRNIFITGGNDNSIAFWDVDQRKTSSSRATRNNNEMLSSLRQFVSYRTVSSDPNCVSECHEAATFLRKLFNAFGAATSLLSPREDVNPVLLAKFKASKQTIRTRTLLFYGHYDVVDAEHGVSGGATKWRADPFNLHPLNGYLYGRGVTDNKGPILAALYAVADLVQHEALVCNVIFLLEGDEESGSRGFRSVVREHKQEIGDVDFILLSNSYWLDDHVPCLTFGMRGVVHASISVVSTSPDLHSGMDGKSMQHEPLKDLTVLLADLIGSSGTEITIPKFYDSVDPLQQSELRAYKGIAHALMRGHPEIKNEDAFTQSLMQRWRDPNLTVHSITVPESKTAVTISSRANATLSIRIVPSQTADEVAANLASFLQHQFDLLQSRNTLEVKITAKADPWLGKVHSEIYEELRDAIIEAWSTDDSAHRAFTTTDDSDTTITSPVIRPTQRRSSALSTTGTFAPGTIPYEPLFIREGGSIPAINFLEREFNAPAAMFPMGQASDNAHLANERMRLENLYKGRDVLKLLFARLGTAPPRVLRASASSVTL